jgi:hypothetical protein
MLRGIALLVGLLAAGSAVAGEMNAEEARRFVIGQGRVFADGSVVGSIQFQGSGQVRYATLPAGTLRVKGEAVCASLRGLPVQPCFNLQRINDNSFRGSISGLGFASCEFTRHNGRAAMAHSTHPLGLRSSLTAENN